MVSKRSLTIREVLHLTLANWMEDNLEIDKGLRQLTRAQLIRMIDGLEHCVIDKDRTRDFRHVSAALGILVDTINGYFMNFPTILSEIAQFSEQERRACLREMMIREKGCSADCHDGEILVLWLEEYRSVEDWMIGLS